MAIVIKTTREVSSDGIKGRRIRELKALTAEQLPNLYLRSDVSFWYSNSSKAFVCMNNSPNNETAPLKVVLREGEWYSEMEFKNALEFIRWCGERLKLINDQLQKKRQEWKGRETISI